jgi:ApaG protein
MKIGGSVAKVERKQGHMYRSTTHQIQVTVEPYFLEDKSAPEDQRYVWGYHVQIENLGQDTVTLKTRYWRITDATGHVQEVRGEGVVGEQPVLGPGESFEYTSGAPLATPSGIMSGSYQMETADGSQIDVEIPAFSLDSPHDRRMLH